MHRLRFDGSAPTVPTVPVMLILIRRTGETVVAVLPDGRKILVTVLTVKGNQARIGFTAPADVQVHREEIHDRIERERNRGR